MEEVAITPAPLDEAELDEIYGGARPENIVCGSVDCCEQ
jgi:hypothetical protein